MGGTLDSLVGPDNLYRVLILGMPAALIVYGTIQIKARESVWTYLGGASFALYLSHPIILGGLLTVWMRLPFRLPPDVIVAAGVAASILFAWRVHELLEKPLLAALRHQKSIPAAGGVSGDHPTA